MEYDSIDSKDFKPITLMFTKSNWIDFYDCYQPYVCKTCNRFDWLKATRNGILAAPKLPVKMPDFFVTSDMRSRVVSESTKRVFDRFSKDIAEFYPIPERKGYYVLLPKQLLTRPAKVIVADEYEKDNPFRSDYPVCKKCKMFPDLCIRTGFYHVPDHVVFAGIVLDTKGMVLVANRELSDYLRKAKIAGMKIEKNAFANGKK